MRSRLPAAFLVGLLVLASCTRTPGPVEITAEDLPFDVARSPSPADSMGPERALTIYLTRGGRLVRVGREVQATVPSAEAALRTMLEGPRPAERARGIGTQLPEDVRLLELTLEPDALRVDLSGEFQEPAPPELIALRVAQVVWTLTEFPEVRAVRFSIDGEQITVTTADGTPIERPVTRTEYAAFRPA